LHYFPLDFDEERSVDSWCGWHNDHSALTGLCPGMFRDVSTNTEISCPDPMAGLYIKTRNNKMVRVKMTGDQIGYQIGECSQVLTGALLRATPHAIRALRYPESKNVARDSFAVFMQPNFDFVLKPPVGISPSEVAVGQYNEEMNFGQFGKATIQFYYSEAGGY